MEVLISYYNSPFMSCASYSYGKLSNIKQEPWLDTNEIVPAHWKQQSQRYIVDPEFILNDTTRLYC